MAAADMEAEIFGGGAGGAENDGQAGVDDGLPAEFATFSPEDIARRARLLDNEVRVLRDEATRLNLEQANLTEKVREKRKREVERERERERKNRCMIKRRTSIDARSSSQLNLLSTPITFLFLSFFFFKKTLSNRSRKTRRRSSSTTSSLTSWETSSRSSTRPRGKGRTARATKGKKTARRPTPTPGARGNASC